jgi:hypothetical protein
MDPDLERTHEWFEVNSGWSPPDDIWLEEWAADGVSKAPDDCVTTVEGTCPHGLASWHRVLAALG